MNDNLTNDDFANFTWLFGKEFFLETSKGNFIWSDPDYNGDNTITPYSGSLQSYLKECGMKYGRGKGRHMIKSYCGEKVIIKT